MDNVNDGPYLVSNPSVVRWLDDAHPDVLVGPDGRFNVDVLMEPPRTFVPDHTGRPTVVLCANREFFPGLWVALVSLLRVHADVPVVIFSWDLTEAQEVWLSKVATVLPRDPCLPDDPMWGRLGLFSLDVPRAVYLDADVVVLRSLDALLHSEAKFAAARNLDWGIVTNFKDDSLLISLGLDPMAQAFNSGVFTADIAFFGHSLYDRMLELHQLYADHFILGDQSAFQLAFYLDDRPFEFVETVFNTMAKFHDWATDPHSPHLIHFAGPDKPWKPQCRQPGQSFFFDHSRLPDPNRP